MGRGETQIKREKETKRGRKNAREGDGVVCVYVCFFVRVHVRKRVSMCVCACECACICAGTYVCWCICSYTRDMSKERTWREKGGPTIISRTI